MDSTQTPKEAAKYYNVSVDTIYRWLAKEIIKGQKIGGVWYVEKGVRTNEAQ